MKLERGKRNSDEYGLMPAVKVLGVIALIITIYMVYRAYVSDQKLFSISLLALLAGLLFETLRIAGNWRKVMGIFIAAYFFSLLSLLPGRREKSYVFENHLQAMPYALIIFFSLLFIGFYKDKITAKLTEGITLLQSISSVYWVIDYGFLSFRNWFVIILLLLVFLFSVFSLVNALTTIRLSTPVQLTLSIWSTIIMLTLGVDNIIHLYNHPDPENAVHFSEGFYTGLQYFLLGVSAVYVLQNFLLLAAFIPGRNSRYSGAFRENKQEHIARYSEEQVTALHALFCMAYAGTLYWLNYTYDLLPRNTMIWLVFFSFTLLTQTGRLSRL
jgi:hypothetical protein